MHLKGLAIPLTQCTGDGSEVYAPRTVSYSVGKDAEDVCSGWLKSSSDVRQSDIVRNIVDECSSTVIGLLCKDLEASNDSISYIKLWQIVQHLDRCTVQDYNVERSGRSTRCCKYQAYQVYS